MKTRLYALVIGSIIFGLSSITQAHHSFSATYNVNQPLEIEGVVTAYSFKNPHMTMRVETTEADGTTTSWLAEGEAATRYRAAGWDKDTFKAGDRIKISGSATHDGSPMIAIEEVHLISEETGDIYASINHQNSIEAALVGSYEEPDYGATEISFIPLTLEDGSPNFTGSWVSNRAIEARPPWGNDPELPYNETGAAVQASWDLTNDPQIFCDPAGVVRKFGFTPHPIEISQYPDRVVFVSEEYSGERVVYFETEAPAAGPKSHIGDSVARYEDGNLIIETVNLLSNPSSLLGNYYSDQATVTEVHSRVDDPQYGSQVKSVITVTDPGFMTEPWVISRIKVFAKGYGLTETECQLPLRERGEAISVPD